LTAVGPDGLKQLASLSFERAHYLAESLTKLPGVQLAFATPFLNEFVITTPKHPSLILKGLLKRNILGGIDLSQGPHAVTNGILVAVTEMNPRAELDAYVTSLKELLEDDSLQSPVQEIDVITTMSRFDKASTATR
jgi:glycine dehydrogenase subunit 1